MIKLMLHKSKDDPKSYTLFHKSKSNKNKTVLNLTCSTSPKHVRIVPYVRVEADASFMEPLPTLITRYHIPILRLSAHAEHFQLFLLPNFAPCGPLLTWKMSHLPIFKAGFQMGSHHSFIE